MTPFRERNPVVIGAVGLTVIALLILAAFNVQNLPLIGGGTTYSAAFTEAGGIKPGDEVRIAGVKVGQVEDVGLQGDHVRVAFRITGDPRFGTTTGAAIRVKTILGAKYLALQPAGPGQLPPGSEIPLNRTVSAYDVVQAFTDLTQTTEQIDTGRLATAMDTVSAAFQDSPADVKAAIRGLSDLSVTIASRDAALRDLADHGSVTVQGVSLTVNEVPAPGVLQVSLVPFTLGHTTLGRLAVGDAVHLEGDMIGKFVATLLRQRGGVA